MTRKLRLRRETLAALVADDLGQVVAAASGVACDTNVCVTACTTCASDFQQCMTGYGCVTRSLGCPPSEAVC